MLVTGSVVSGLGKGVTSSSIGALLRSRGLNVTAIKIDPYLNQNAGSMSPFEHGEVYVLGDGGEVDLDCGSYERFLGDVSLTKDHNLTTGKIYSKVFENERRGDYLGKTVQVVPHLTDAIQDWIHSVALMPVTVNIADQNEKTGDQTTGADVCLVEVGGTTGDMEGAVYLEALRELKVRVGVENLCHVHVSLVPTVVEHKTRPTQKGVRELLSCGLIPDVLVCRTMDKPMDPNTVNKIARACGMPASCVISVCDTRNIYAVPNVLNKAFVDTIILKRLKLDSFITVQPDLSKWCQLAEHISPAVSPKESPTVIGIVGKYTALKDAYLSVSHALQHASFAARHPISLRWIEADDLEKQPEAVLSQINGLLVPGGFGNRGIEGMIAAVQYARTHKLPFLGICLGLQIATIEWSRNTLQKPNANSTEFNPTTPHPVIHAPPPTTTPPTSPTSTTTTTTTTSTTTATANTVVGSVCGLDKSVGKMCLGNRTTVLGSKSLASVIYGGRVEVVERHRHRYQVNQQWCEALVQSGLVLSGHDKADKSVHAIELPLTVHPFFFAVQYHPEFLSRPFQPSPPFLAFVQAAKTHSIPK